MNGIEVTQIVRVPIQAAVRAPWWVNIPLVASVIGAVVSAWAAIMEAWLRDQVTQPPDGVIQA